VEFLPVLLLGTGPNFSKPGLPFSSGKTCVGRTVCYVGSSWFDVKKEADTFSETLFVRTVENEQLQEPTPVDCS